MKAPPLLPEETLLRVLRVARFDGFSMAFVAGSFALLSALSSDVRGAVIGVLVAGCGSMELHGATLLSHTDSRGMRWLIFSQIGALFSIVGYCIFQVLRPHLQEIPAELDSVIQQSAAQLGMSKHDYMLLVFNRVLYLAVGVATLIYQSSMAFYYLRRRDTVIRALEIE